MQWDDNWVSFMDTMLQFSIMGKDLRELYLPTRMEKVIINPAKHLEILTKMKEVPVYMYKDINVIKCGGVEMRGLKASLAPRRSGTQAAPKLEKYMFVSQNNSKDLTENTEKSRTMAVTVAVHLALENSGGALKLKVAESATDKLPENILALLIQEIIETEPTMVADVAVVTTQPADAYAQIIGVDSGIRIVNKDSTAGPIEQNCHLVIGYDIFSRNDGKKILTNLKDSIKEDGFILLEENFSTFENEKQGTILFKELGLNLISNQKCDKRVFVLLRPVIKMMNERKSKIIEVTEKNFNWLEQLKEALAKAEETNEFFYLVSQGEELFGAVGFMNCIKSETGGKFARMYYIQDKNSEKFSLTSKFYAEQISKDLITNVVKNKIWGTFRHVKLEAQPDTPTLQVEHAYVNALTKGDLSSLKWIEGPLSRDQPDPKDQTQELCTVYYAPINFRDVMICSGKLAADALPGDLATQDCILGLEFSGRDSTGKRVMAMVPAKSLATTCVVQKNLLWDIPEQWTMEQASTVPCVYSTVYYALVMRGRIKKGDSILIHAGSGGVGQAAISVALHHGLNVFTTVGSKEKRDFLKKTFPKLNDKNIGNSRDCSFEQMIMRQTRGRGVDVVLNSLADEKLQASVRCLGLNGRFLEIGKLDLNNNTALGMSVFLKNTSFHGILVDSVMEGDAETIKEIVKLVDEGIKSGAVRPLPTSCFTDSQVEQAFR